MTRKRAALLVFVGLPLVVIWLGFASRSSYVLWMESI